MSDMENFVRQVAENGGVISDSQMSSLLALTDLKEQRGEDAIERYNTLKTQAERIAYLEQRVMEQREEIQRLSNQHS